MTVLDLLAEAGGPTNNAYLEKISVVNMSCCQGQARTFDLVNFSKTANIYDLPVIRAGDTIYIPHKDESFAEKAGTNAVAVANDVHTMMNELANTLLPPEVSHTPSLNMITERHSKEPMSGPCP